MAKLMWTASTNESAPAKYEPPSVPMIGETPAFPLFE